MNDSQEAKLHLLDYWPVITIRLRLVPLILLFVAIIVGVPTFLMPKDYLDAKYRYLFGGLAPGLVLGVAFTYFFAQREISLKTKDEKAKLLDLPVLAVIPKGTRILPQTTEYSPDAEAYRVMKTNVAQRRKFPRSMFVRVKAGLQNIGTKCLGVVLNKVDVKQDNNYQYYTAYSQYFPKPQPKEKAA